MRSSSGWSTSARRTGQGWKVSVPMCAHHTGTAISVGQISSAVRPDGKVICDGLEVVGSALGHPLLVERVGVPVLRTGGQPHALADPGRSSAPAPSAGRAAPASARPRRTAKYSATISLVTSGVRVGGLVDHPVGAGHAHGALPGVHLGGGWLRHGPQPNRWGGAVPSRIRSTSAMGSPCPRHYRCAHGLRRAEDRRGVAGGALAGGVRRAPSGRHRAGLHRRVHRHRDDRASTGARPARPSCSGPTRSSTPAAAGRASTSRSPTRSSTSRTTPTA